MRLRELEKRLKSEREARIIDRSGAKKRLEEEREEIEVLRRELEREREKWLSAEVPGVEGPKERLSIEDVKKDDSVQLQQQQEPQQQQQQQQQGTSTSSVRDSRERKDLTVGERRPRRSSRAPLPNFTDPSPDQQPSPRVDYKDRGHRESAPEDPQQLQPSPPQRERGSSSRRPAAAAPEDDTRRERGVSRHRAEETREERRERKEREREERRARKEREGGSLRGDAVVSPVNSGVSTGDR